MSATFGRMSPQRFATFDRDTSSWRMSEVTSLWGSETYSETWPASGMTRNGESFELPMPALHTDGNASSSLLPTPVASEPAKATNRQNAAQKAKTGQVWLTNVAHTIREANEMLLPTPCASPSGNTPENHLRKKPGRAVVTDLLILVENDLLQSGGRIEPQSNDGNESPAALPLPLPSRPARMAGLA